MALEQLPVLSGQIELMDQVRERLTSGGIIVLSGITGSGKTVFCEKLLAYMEDDIEAGAYLSCREITDPIDAERLVVQQLVPESTANSITTLSAVLRGIAVTEKVRVLVLDDADTINISFLDMLADVFSYFGENKCFALLATCHKGGEKLISTVFSGNCYPPVELEMPSLTPKDCCAVEASTVKFSGSNVKYKLHDSIFFTDKQWTPGEISHIVHKTLGIDENNSAVDVDTDKNEGTVMSKQKSKLLVVLGISVALLVSCLVYCAFLYIRYLNEMPATVVADSVSPKVDQIQVVTQREDKVVSALPDSLTDNELVIANNSEQKKNEIVVDDEALKTIANSETGSAEKTSMLENSDLKKLVETNGKQNLNPNKTNVVASQVTEPAVKTEIEHSPNKTLAPAVSEISEKTDNKVQTDVYATKKQSTDVKTSENSAKEDSNISQVTKVKFESLDNKNLVIQIIATPSRRDAEKIASRIDGGHQTWVIKRESRGDYIALVGPFVKKSEADKAIAALPSDIKKAGPWTKSVAAVRRDLAK